MLKEGQKYLNCFVGVPVEADTQHPVVPDKQQKKLETIIHSISEL